MENKNLSNSNLSSESSKNFYNTVKTFSRKSLNNTEKLSLFVEDAKKLGLKILQPCINKSSYEFIIEDISSHEFGIRYSLSSIKNVGTDAIKKIVQIRDKDGEFNNIDDFLNKIPYSLITKKSFESLIKSGAFDEIEANRNKLFRSIDLMLNYSHSIEKEKKSHQSNLFNGNDNNKLLINLQDNIEWSLQERINNEFLSLGLYLSAHPLDSYSNILPNMNVIRSIEILNEPEKFIKQNIKLCGLISKIQKRQSLRGRWVSIQLNDLSGSLDINIFSDVLVKYEDYLIEKNLILIDVEIKNENNQTSRITAKRIYLLNDYISDNKYNITLFTNTNQYLDKLVPLLKILEVGHSDILINSSNKEQQVEIKIRENIKLSSKFINDLSTISGIDHFKFS